MTRYAVRRVGGAVVVLLVVSVVVFVLLHLAPGDPAAVIAGPDADAATIASVRASLGLDHPLLLQYVDFLRGLVQGHLGESYTLRQPIGSLIGQRVGSTVELTVFAAVLMIVLGLLMGVAMATSRSRRVRAALDAVANLALALPPFVSGVVLIFLFAVVWHALPSGGDAPLMSQTASSVRRLILPAIAMALPAAPVIARLLATEMRRISDEEFVQTAIAKGARPRHVVWRHVVPNSLGPAVLEVGIRIGQLLGGAVVAEAIFARSGLGSLLVQSVQSRDYRLAQVLLMLVVVTAILVQLVAELVAAAIDPRVREELAR